MTNLKQCCATFYENEALSTLLGGSFHPGGEELTLKIGQKLNLNKDSHLLDVACGAGSSALVLGQQFGCHVTGMDLSEKNLVKAEQKAVKAGLSETINFTSGDAEKMGFGSEQFDAVILECALSTFADQKSALSEIHRVLKPGGQAAVSDMIVCGDVPADIDQAVLHVTCILGATSPAGYSRLLHDAGFLEVDFEDHSYTIVDLLDKVENMSEAWNVIEQLSGCDLEKLLSVSLDKISDGIDRARAEIERGNLGYGLIMGIKG